MQVYMSDIVVATLGTLALNSVGLYLRTLRYQYKRTEWEAQMVGASHRIQVLAKWAREYDRGVLFHMLSPLFWVRELLMYVLEVKR